MKLAIIGGGPAGFYLASRILSRSSDPALRIHIFDRLWSPHGLVRYGVAPDHPEVKNCTHKFDEQVASDGRFSFFGNVNVGNSAPLQNTIHIPLRDIQRNYSHLVFTTGCTVPTNHSALPPSPWVIPALRFVHWYTQHPSSPPAPALDKMTRVALIGNGNVALDIARMLLTDPSVLQQYDVPVSVLSILKQSKVSHVDILARRGPLQAAFTAKELRELLNLPNAAMEPIPSELLAIPADTTPSRAQSRIFQLLQKGSKMSFGNTPKSFSLRFFVNPTGLVPPLSEGMPQLQLEQTSLDAAGRALSGSRLPPLPVSLVVPSIGLQPDPALGPIRTRAGRVLSANGHSVLKNMYAAGWAATGARGVIATTMMDAYAVGDTLLDDLGGCEGEMHMNPEPSDDRPPEVIQTANRIVTSYADWKRVDAEEVRRGQQQGKERERMTWSEARAFLWDL
ncbi:NADPH:adrenodoxin oxidoreductase, mitochondrial [Mycena indigotica]|uniref:NADPH:adrenodoxin oxidoreductase, mitochondrial n=1 Tax=Mycena indigotica TaxID=2126181 RepID=A0A8H6T5K9_9AGAR|nr:NADPH:adrenodoxin oxidoreductase, mitochondrial [Mycena indigotica]KAF7309835.1 NADPH:adrenodoxin oxidoreductase, mitochondrial [Mycena indigotica]